MNKGIVRRWVAFGAAVSAAAAVAAWGTSASAADRGTPPRQETESVRGSAGGELRFPGWEGHPVRFDIDAHGTATGASGRFHVNHRLPDGTAFADFEAKVDCLAVDGRLAILTGVIERAEVPGMPSLDLVGKRVGLTVRDHGRHRDEIGWSWAYGGFDADVLPCTSGVPVLRVSEGDYRFE
ncbi:hypothetical protein SAMN05216266_101521 [Amycolatopsis marina]|uniref:Uncharacterized protein n=1 Tax=Amycolatopsis marina TaxID=490629 RepID=A0A1I0VV63_9PSEU|nr:hypothetical protein [Amycolatopsis marina]SFA80232.1 hypothetical protein SAMN05216266_101521 [Amycolatopsis marina]